MNQVTFDAGLQQLRGRTGAVELRDETGWPLGFYLPVTAHERLLRAWTRAQLPPGFYPGANGAAPPDERVADLVVLDLRALAGAVDWYAQETWCDASGTPQGYYLPLYSDPEARSEHKRSCYAAAAAQQPEADLESRRCEPGGRTLAEIWQRLGRVQEQDLQVEVVQA
jgi:hypothetical protein